MVKHTLKFVNTAKFLKYVSSFFNIVKEGECKVILSRSIGFWMKNFVKTGEPEFKLSLD